MRFRNGLKGRFIGGRTSLGGWKALPPPLRAYGLYAYITTSAYTVTNLRFFSYRIFCICIDANIRSSFYYYFCVGYMFISFMFTYSIHYAQFRFD